MFKHERRDKSSIQEILHHLYCAVTGGVRAKCGLHITTYLQKAQMESMESGEKEELCEWRNLIMPHHTGDKGQNQ